MKWMQLVLAVLLTAVLLYIAQSNSMGRPEHLLHVSNGYTFEMTTIPKAYQMDTVRIVVQIQGPLEEGLTPVLRHAKFGQDETTRLYRYDTTPLELGDSAMGRYQYLATAGTVGGKMLYYFQIRDQIGGLRAEFTNNGGPFLMKYIGRVPGWVLITHIGMMFATVFLVVLGALRGAEVIRYNGDVRPMARVYLWAAVCAFIGGYPLGLAMNWYTFGVTWEGIPFGTDVTDNKTQVLFVYLVMVTLSSLGSLSRGKLGNDVYSPRTLGCMGVIGFPVLLGIYLIPHSIQFAPWITELVCWSLIGIMGAVYVTGLALTFLRRRKGSKRVRSEAVS